VGGEVVVTGRAKDVVIIRGANYYPHDFEDTMQAAHPDLREDFAVAFSVPGEETEQLVLVQGAAIKVADHETLAQATRQIVRAVTDEHGLRPDAVVLVAPKHIPRTSSGKVRRSATRDAYLGGQLPTLYEWRATGNADRAIPGSGTVDEA
jgi:acyl-CoA synthetase (AMP-forming)/AMP-acid ligase II